MPDWVQFVVERLPELGLRTVQHLALTGVSTALAVLVGVPLGILALRVARLKGLILGTAGILQTIPSLALLTLLLVLFHKIGALPAIVALTLYALLPIVRNTVTGLEGISADILEAARGIGMTPRQETFMVRLPLALPVIIAGVRTAAVTAVGVATLSAFIGAGGLGQFINRGLALANWGLILLGAIPAAILALLVDLLVAGVRWAVDPERRIERRRRPDTALRCLALAAPVLLLAGGSLGYARTRPDVTIGSKPFTEQIILGHMLAELIEAHTDLKVDRRFCLGGTMICHEALDNGEIDLYIEYTGTGLMAVLGRDMIADPDEVYRVVSREYLDKFDARWMPPLGLNNTYAIAVRREDAKRHGWEKVSDLRPYAAELRIGFPFEFYERPDGYQPFTAAYGFEFGEVREVQAGLMYDVIRAGEVDVIPAFATDGRIAEYDLVPLEDDRRFFPPYYAAPVVRTTTLLRYPRLEPVLAKLAGVLDDETMQRLNFRVDGKGEAPDAVAREFLSSERLLP